ncbi:putative holin-like toxin [Enterocloster bolteae]|uniref:putative holin-like toxin n=1 Tax=Enterocloster bolteae TaxID=208479 RepID=UPI0034DF9799
MPYAVTLLFCIISTGSSYCWVTSISERRWCNMSTYEALSLMIAFGVLIVMIIGTKK